MIDQERLREVLEELPGIPYEGILTRHVDFAAYSAGNPARLLYDEGARQNGQRYTPPGGAKCLYFGEGLKVTAAEYTQRGLAALKPDRADTRVQLNAEVKLNSVLDLKDASVRRKLGTTIDELKELWRHSLPSPPREDWAATWILGQAVFDSEQFDGIRFPSAQLDRHYCMLILTERLANGAHVRVKDSQGNWERIPVN